MHLAGTGTSYYFLGGKRIAVRTSAGLYYPHPDHLGSHSVSADAAGAVTARLSYKPYGVTVGGTDTLSADFGFTG